MKQSSPSLKLNDMYFLNSFLGNKSIGVPSMENNSHAENFGVDKFLHLQLECSKYDMPLFSNILVNPMLVANFALAPTEGKAVAAE